MVSSALARGHTVTVFNRGLSRSVWPAAVEVLTGQRSSDLPSLSTTPGRRWDAVIDTCGYVPRDLRISANALKNCCGSYLFVSSISAYGSFAHSPVRETDPLASAPGLDPGDRNPQHYGAQKAACESEVMAILGEAALIVRPDLIVGPGDSTGRFSYWPWRVAAGGDVLVPEIKDAAPLQFIDVRDLAEWMLHLLESRCTGTFNATGPAGGLVCDWGNLLSTCADIAAKRNAPTPRFAPVAEDFLVAQGVQPWTELPLWVPSSDVEMLGFMRVSLERGEGHGLLSRPLCDTVAAVLNEGVPAADDERRKGKLDQVREREIIAAWRAASDTLNANRPSRGGPVLESGCEGRI